MGNQKSKNTKNADTKEKNEGKKTEEEKHREDRIENTGQVTLDKNDKKSISLPLLEKWKDMII